MTEPRLYAIGDLHGHHKEWIDLWGMLQKDGMDTERDTLVFLGDYVDGGPDTCSLLMWLIDMQREYPHWVFLKGNHEQMWLDALEGHETATDQFAHWFYQGGQATTDSYQTAGGGFRVHEWQRHREWVASLPLYHETDRHIFVHAGLRPPLPPAANTDQDMLWIRDEFIHSGYDWGKRVVFGHTPMPEPLVQRNKIGIDTMPRDSGYLTAVELSGDEPRFIFGARS